MFQKNVRRSFIEYLQSNLYQNPENCYIGSESTFSQSLIYNRPTDRMKDTTSPRPPHGQAMGASDATPLMRGQERHPEQTARITSQQRPAGELCLFSDSFSADGILRVSTVYIWRVLSKPNLAIQILLPLFKFDSVEPFSFSVSGTDESCLNQFSKIQNTDQPLRRKGR